MSSDPFVIHHITFDPVKLIDQNGQFHNSVKTLDAQKMARAAGLDLVCFNKPEGTELAFCKITNLNKWKYEEDKKRKKQNKEHRKQCKEIRFSPNIEDNDIEHKTKQVNEFLDDGDDVVLTMKLKGREKAHFDLAEEKMNKIISMCSHGKESSRKKNEGMIIVRMGKI